MEQPIKNIVLLGSGNLATHLSTVLVAKGYLINQVYSKHIEHAQKLATVIKCSYTSELSEIITSADCYLFALSDSAIVPVLEKGLFQNKLLVHCAGSINCDVFKPYSNTFGVIYPCQSFTRERPIDFAEMPLFVEGSNSETEQRILLFAKQLTTKVFVATSEERLILHLAAVFASNYSNHMLSIASEVLKETNISFETLKPLVLETILKAFDLGPFDAQTGPARRNNLDVLSKHKSMLAKHPDWQKIYTFVSESIKMMHNK